MRINKYLASAGLGSRRKVEELVNLGKIKVNGEIVYNLATEVSEDAVVEYNGKKIGLEEQKIYIMLNKPKCYITSAKDEKERRTVLDLVKGVKARIYPVGRLDFNTEGLLILTNDGDFTNNIIHPSKHISKTYEVITKIKPTRSGLTELRKGIIIDGIKTIPAIVENPKVVENGFLTVITIFEGRNHQVKNMFSAIGCKVYDLKRVAIGRLELGDLPKGKFRSLDKSDLEKIFK